ncbi:hypothetical protein M3148_11295 [Georgenia satyanarayanai]|uniref:hypothetical protein n=1 Tax=Georgenia satyanarayanai TaxID=860221 RepID=UPI00203FBB0E|nr:hypothetical protein [Georgenia satyanarayanai]MCM3661568.1 hypothetical protein [Georgenia satyanarayanai]
MSSTPSSAAAEVWQRPFVRAHQHWCDDFVLELRMRDVPGPVIGDRLAEVEAHCVDSGDSPEETFGNPTEYARRLDQDRSPELVAGVWRVAIIAAVQVVALLVGTSAASAWARGEALSYNAVQLGAVVLLGAVLLALPVLLRPLVARPWAVGVPLALLTTTAGVGAAVAGRLDLPALVTLPPAAVAVALFVVVVVLAVLEHRELTSDDDTVTSPLPPADAPAAPRRGRFAALMPPVLVPLAYVVFAALPWVLH